MIRQLHLGNIANVAYGYCKLLRQYGHDASVLCYDPDHVSSWPEWMDTDIEPLGFDDDSPERCGERVGIDSPPEWYRRIKSVGYSVGDSSPSSELTLSRGWAEVLIRFSRRYGRRWTLTHEDISSYKPLVDTLAVHFFPQYDVIFGYAYAAVLPLLGLVKPFVPVEVRTLREIPFEDTALGRLLAMAYRVAPHVIITNPDVLSVAQELELERYSFVPLPVDEEVWRPLRPNERRDLHGQYQADFLLFAPARQNWSVKGNDMFLAAFAQLLKRGLNVRLIAAAWGEEVERSKAFSRELGVEEKVVWLDPMPEMALLKYYNACDLVLDQFGESRTFGLITLKAMACGTPVLLSYDPAIHEWCFNEQPPVIPANDTKAIYELVLHYLTHQEARKELSRRGREWVVANHSKSVIVKKLERIIESFEDDGNTRVLPYDSLKQKKLELAYEEAFSDIYHEKYHGSIVHQTMDDKLIAVLKKHIELADLKSPHVLDLGCGPGSLTEKLSAISGIKLTGVDISPAMIHQAKAKFPESDFFVDDLESLSFDEGAFDVVFCSGVLHHLPRLDEALKEIHRVLRPGGILILREPNADNFAARFPEVAFAGLCLRHYLLHVTGFQQPSEPEAHHYHRAFDFMELAEELRRYFCVIDFHTDMKTSYFYDMLYDPGINNDIERLDAALIGQPGLNIIFVARKAAMPGIENSVIETLHRMKSYTNIDPVYFEYLYEFAGDIFEKYHDRFCDYLTDLQSVGLNGFLRQTVNSKSILLSSDDAEYCHKQIPILLKRCGVLPPERSDSAEGHGIWSRAARFLGLTARPMESPKHFDLKLPEAMLPSDRNAYDVGLFYIRNQISLRKLVELMACVKDYGFIYLEVNEGASLVNIEEEYIDYLNQLTVLKYFDPPAGKKYLLYLTRYLCSPKDFYKALFVGIEKERARYPSNQLPSIDRIAASSRAEWDLRSNEYGHLEQVALTYLLKDWLTGGDHSPILT